MLFSQQQTETTAAVRTKEEELVEGLRTEFHETACKIQSLQAETESLRTLVSKALRPRCRQGHSSTEAAGQVLAVRGVPAPRTPRSTCETTAQSCQSV